MATILVVEDRPTDRLFLATLLGYQGHRVLEAADGAQALDQVRAERPDLVISDLLLPRMDGFEFVRQLRVEPAVAGTPVIFYTATYDNMEARSLALSCGVSSILPKPSDPEVILRTVGEALGGSAPGIPPPAQTFDREHLSVVNEKLYRKAARLTALVEVGRQLAAERDLERLLDLFCRAAQGILEAEWAAVGLLDGNGLRLRHFTSSGLRTEAAALEPPDPQAGVLGKLLAEGRYIRLRDLRGPPEEIGLPSSHPRVSSFLGVPITSPWQTHGWLYVVNRCGADEFSAEDDQVAVTLAGQLAVAFENVARHKEIQRQKDELLEAARRKDEFLAMLAHELRNPLSPIRNALHIMKQPGADVAMVARVREMMERQVQHMARLLDDLLDVSRISRGRIELRMEIVDVARLVQRTVEAIRSTVEQRGHELALKLPANPSFVKGDPTRLEQVLTNLLNNAAKYTDPGGHIWFSAEREGNEIRLRVRDTGIGISAEMLPRVFDLFVQAERRLDRSQGGVGIGLTLVRRLVELHGGTVEAVSAGAGQGSEFIVHLPAVLEGQNSVPGPPAGPNLSPSLCHRVLVVDDNLDAAESLAMLVKLEGQDVRVAYDGPRAIVLAQAFRPQVVFLDLGMPGMDGYEAAKRLRRLPGLANVVLVAVTGWGQEEDYRRSREAGFHHHLVKPVEPKSLQELLLSQPLVEAR